MRCSYGRIPAQESSNTAFVNEDWGQKAVGDAATGDLMFLLLRVRKRVTRVGFSCDPLYSDHEIFSLHYRVKHVLRPALVTDYVSFGSSGLALLPQIASRLCGRFPAHPFSWVRYRRTQTIRIPDSSPSGEQVAPARCLVIMDSFPSPAFSLGAAGKTGGYMLQTNRPSEASEFDRRGTVQLDSKISAYSPKRIRKGALPFQHRPTFSRTA